MKEKLKLVPSLPGSYQMKDKDGMIIYVGKAKNLKNRLKSYFTGRVEGKTKVLVENIHDFDYIVTSSELESLILEITLIKKYNPKYNVLLKDDKSYPYIELNINPYPTLKIVRNVKLKKNKDNLYGPFPNAGAAIRIVNMLNRIYPLKKCDKLKKDLCLYYHIGECLGYCKKNINIEETNKMIKEIKDFLSGNSNEIKNKIKDKMLRLSDSMQYEKALEYKNMLEDINIILKEQKIVTSHSYNIDLMNAYMDNNYICIETFFIRNGILFGNHKQIINTLDNIENVLTEYIIKFYEKNILPKELIVPDYIDTNLLSEYLNINVRTPQKGDLKKLFELSYENAKIHLDSKIESLKNNNTKRHDAINELKKILNLEKIERIESFDNSHLFSTYYVGAMVVFRNFLPDKNEYRKYKLDIATKDDLAAMREVLYRRYYKLIMENTEKPDLIVIDGGKNQIKICNEIINELNLKIEIIGLIKDNHHRTSTIMTKDYKEIKLDTKSNLFLYLSSIQEEVHRYAITYHRTIKNKGTLASILDNVNGIGEQRRKLLLKKYTSINKIKEANIEDLSKIIPTEIAINLQNYLKEQEKN